MHLARRIYEHPRTGPAAILLGVILIALESVMTGHEGSGIRTIGIVLAVGGVQLSTMMVIVRSGYAAAHRDGYRRGRRVSKPVVVLVPRNTERRALMSAGRN
jgi:hypothetical protein